MGKRPYYKPSGLGGVFIAILIGVSGLIGLFLSNYGFLLIPLFAVTYYYFKNFNKKSKFDSRPFHQQKLNEENYGWWDSLPESWKKELNFQIGKPKHNYSGTIGNKTASFINLNGTTERPNITELNEILNISSLWISSFDIKSLEPLKRFNKLTELRLWRQQLNGIEPLRHQKNLTKLNLGIWNSISDISPLKDLENLVELDLTNNPISENQISDLKRDLPNCKILY